MSTAGAGASPDPAGHGRAAGASYRGAIDCSADSEHAQSREERQQAAAPPENAR
jgi:hypothetical protein